MNKLSDIKVVIASPDDAYGIHEVFYKTWLDTYPNKEAGITVEDVEHWYKDDFTEENLQKTRESLSNPKKERTLLLAKDGDKVVGVCRVVRRSDKNQLQAIYVLPEYQRKGVGKLLWEEAQKFFDNGKDIVVEVATYNSKAIEFYKKLGFVDTGKRWSDETFKTRSGAMSTEMEMILKTTDK
jgi:ribosomal protein S18 acetylase RimI-like enzyme